MIDDSKLAIAHLEITRRFSKLDDADSPVDALRKLQAQEYRAMELQFLNMLETKFSWRQLLRSPFHSIWLHRMRVQYLEKSLSVNRSEWIKLKRLIIRIRFGFFIDFSSADVLKTSINKKLLTEHDAWRLLHSPGCQVSKGKLTPAFLSASVGKVGLTMSASLSLVAVTLLLPLLMLILGNCNSPTCVIFGNTLAATLLLVFAHLIAVCTWGRRQAANALASILWQEGLDGSAGLAVKWPLMHKLFW